MTQPAKAPKAAEATKPNTDNDGAQVEDHASERLTPDEVANAAASSLHGDKAVEEKYVQPAARELAGGNTLISDSTEAEAAREGDRR